MFFVSPPLFLCVVPYFVRSCVRSFGYLFVCLVVYSMCRLLCCDMCACVLLLCRVVCLCVRCFALSFCSLDRLFVYSFVRVSV